MTPKENLRQEHGTIMRVFSAWQGMIEKPHRDREKGLADLEQVMEFLEEYIDQGHHEKEDHLLFPLLEELNHSELNQLVSELREEHRTGRTLLKEIQEEFGKLCREKNRPHTLFTQKARDYIGLFRKHIRKENAKLLPEIETSLSKEKQARLQRGFDTHPSKPSKIIKTT